MPGVLFFVQNMIGSLEAGPCGVATRVTTSMF
jgi:hypothetical protein